MRRSQPAGQRPFTRGPGRWSFLYQSQLGASQQWIERKSRAWDCLRGKGTTKWTCSGPGQFEDSNGIFLAITPYIPDVVLNDKENEPYEWPADAPGRGHPVLDAHKLPVRPAAMYEGFQHNFVSRPCWRAGQPAGRFVLDHGNPLATKCFCASLSLHAQGYKYVIGPPL
jgi:hypothetical protein